MIRTIEEIILIIIWSTDLLGESFVDVAVAGCAGAAAAESEQVVDARVADVPYDADTWHSVNRVLRTLSINDKYSSHSLPFQPETEPFCVPP